MQAQCTSSREDEGRQLSRKDSNLLDLIFSGSGFSDGASFLSGTAFVSPIFSNQTLRSLFINIMHNIYDPRVSVQLRPIREAGFEPATVTSYQDAALTRLSYSRLSKGPGGNRTHYLSVNEAPGFAPERLSQLPQPSA